MAGRPYSCGNLADVIVLRTRPLAFCTIIQVLRCLQPPFTRAECECGFVRRRQRFRRLCEAEIVGLAALSSAGTSTTSCCDGECISAA